MGQKRITIEVTETQANAIRWALDRALMVTPASYRGKLFTNKLTEAHTVVQGAVQGIPPLSNSVVNSR